MTGAEAWLTLIGNTVTGKVDGEVIFEYYRKDGTLALLEGSEITKGKWSLEGERVCFKYPDEDKDCQTISRTGDEVIFKRKDKSGYRLKVLAGQPEEPLSGPARKPGFPRPDQGRGPFRVRRPAYRLPFTSVFTFRRPPPHNICNDGSVYASVQDCGEGGKACNAAMGTRRRVARRSRGPFRSSEG